MSSNNNSDRGQSVDDSDNSVAVVGPDTAAPTGGEESVEAKDEPGVLREISRWSELSMYITAFNPAALEEIGSDASVQIQLTCDICLEKRLELPSWIDRLASTNTEHNSEKVCVLPCGHFFGFDCISRWMYHRLQEDDHQIPVCPNCRFELIHPLCEHPLEFKVVPLLSPHDPKNITYHVPFTRVHKLQPGDETKFVDVSGWDPKEANDENVFGVTEECEICEGECEDWLVEELRLENLE